MADYGNIGVGLLLYLWNWLCEKPENWIKQIQSPHLFYVKFLTVPKGDEGHGGQKMIYHYTSLEALFGILHSDAMCFRATRFSHLDDPYEFHWALEKFGIKEMDGMEYPYIISFCKVCDFLNMWKLYGHNGHGVMLCIDETVLLDEINEKQNSKKCLHTMKIGHDVGYANDENFDETVQILVEEHRKCYESDEEGYKTDLIEISPFIKRDDYEIENEWRYTLLNFSSFIVKYNRQDPSSPIFEDEKENINNIKVHTNSPKQYTEIKLPIESLKGIVIGYNIPKEWIGMLKSYLPTLNTKYSIATGNIKQSKYSKL